MPPRTIDLVKNWLESQDYSLGRYLGSEPPEPGYRGPAISCEGLRHSYQRKARSGQSLAA